MFELAILGALSSSWGLTKDLYAFARNAKAAGCDIRDLDLKLNNDRLLLKRYDDFLRQHLDHLNDEERSHLKETFECIQKSLLKTPNAVCWYRRNGKTVHAIWALFGSEVEKEEKKLAAWVSSLQAWLAFASTGPRKELSNQEVTYSISQAPTVGFGVDVSCG